MGAPGLLTMADVLFIKTSSLGDVIHHMPALTEARRQRPTARFCWVVEEAFAPLVQIHPAVSDVISVASRRWRGTPLAPSTWREIADFGRAVRARRYDDIIDTQGLVRSALHRPRGPRGGMMHVAASWFYDVRYRVARDLHAIARNRMPTLPKMKGGFCASSSRTTNLSRLKALEILD
jgi:heptosyltransferase-1